MNSRVNRLKASVVALFVAAGLVASLLSSASRANGAPASAGPPDLYRVNCASCHGADGGGTPAGKKLGARDLRSGDVQGMSDAQLRNIIANGKGKMQGFGKRLGGDQIDQLVARVRQMR